MKAENRPNGGNGLSMGSGRGQLVRNTLIVMTAAVLSRFLGVLRTSVFAYQFGTGNLLEAYNAAFGVIDIIYLLVMGGALGSSLIPVFTQFMTQQREEDAWNLVNTILHLAIGAAVFFSVVLFIFTSPIVRWVILPGETASQQALTVDIIRILLIQPIILGVCGVSMAILNSFKKFLLTSLGPLVYNISIIIGALFFSSPNDISGLLGGVIAGAVAYLAVLLPGLIKTGFRYKPRISLKNPGVLRVFGLLGPRILGQTAFHVNIVALRAFASFGGSVMVTTLEYSYRLFNLPLGLLGISIGTVSFPTLSVFANREEWGSYGHTLKQVFRVVLFLAIPIAVGLFALRFEIIRILYERGRFDPAATQVTAQFFMFFLIGLPLCCITEVAVRAFYSVQNTRIPVIVGILTVAVNVSLAFPVSRILGFPYLALTFSITNSLEAIVLMALLNYKLKLNMWGEILKSVIRSVGASAVMFAALYSALQFSEDILPTGGLLPLLGEILLFTLFGMAVYLGATRLFRSPEIAEASRMLKSKLKKK